MYYGCIVRCVVDGYFELVEFCGGLLVCYVGVVVGFCMCFEYGWECYVDLYGIVGNVVDVGCVG